MKYIYYISFIMLFGLTACEFDEQIDPNNPSVNGVLDNATQAQLNNLVYGSLSQMRPELNNFYDVTGVIGREIYRFSGSDPRWLSDLLSGTLDNNAFYTTRVWGDRYQCIKNCNLLIEGASNSVAITDAQLQGYLGFAKTIIANEYLVMAYNQYGDMRIDVADPDNLGPLVSRAEVFNYVDGLLEDARGHLQNGEFAFDITSGFSGFETTADFIGFNWGLAARVALNQSDWAGAIEAVDNSFADMSGSMTNGVYYTFSAAAGDQLNPVFLPLNNTGENRLAHPSFLSDIRSGDTRISKAAMRDEAVTESNLTGTHDVAIYAGNTSSIPMIKNEELILVKAEALANQGDVGGAVQHIDAVGTSYGLNPYTGGTSTSELIDEILYQRRYSLFYEGHRWNDLIRLGLTDRIPRDRTGDVLHTVFPVPFDDNF